MSVGSVDRCIERLSAVCEGLAPLQHALFVGRIVAEELHGGKPGAWHHDKWAAARIRRLVADPRLPISEASLYRSMGVHEIVTRIAPSPDSLRLAHYRAVLGLPAAVQDMLLAAAVREGLTSRDLAARVQLYRHGQGDRYSKAKVDRTRRKLRRMADSLDELPRVDDVTSRKLLVRIREQVASLLGASQ